jgi:RimJ/RimL family protein N-acetyltransferase
MGTGYQTMMKEATMAAPTVPTLRSSRLVLRAFTLSDAAAVQLLAGDRDIAASTVNIPHPYNDGAAEEWISTHQCRFERGESAIFAVALASDGRLIGSIGLEIRRDHARAELGYWVGRPYGNRGYCTEAALEALRFAFEELGLSRVFACHFKSNEASGRVMHKLGMTKEGEFRQHVVKWGVPRDLVLYGILRPEFKARLPGT